MKCEEATDGGGKPMVVCVPGPPVDSVLAFGVPI